MKTFNAEKAINSQLKLIFILFWLTTLVLMITNGEQPTEIQLHPWLAGIAETTQNPSFGWIVFFRILFIIGSTLLVWQISIRHLELSRKDYMLFFILPVIHFTITDWGIGLMAAIYWTVFLLILFLLLPGETARPELRRTLTASIFGGILLLNGAFAFLFFIAGIVIMIIGQTISFRRAIIWLTGFFTPAFFLFFWYFMTDRTGVISGNPGAFMMEEEMLQFNFPLLFYGCPGLLFVMIILVHSRMGELKISVRRNYSALLFSLIVLAPAVLTSLFNTRILFSIYGLAIVFYWIKSIYNARRKAGFVVLYLLPILFPVLYYYLLKF